MKIALVTYEDEGKYAGEGSSEDERLLNYLNQKGLKVSFAVWTDPEIDWQAYDQVILKSPWDYFDKINLFHRWLNLLDEKKVSLLNPTTVVRWNTNKAYLLEVEQAGFAIVPTALIPFNNKFKAAAYFQKYRTENLIVKPAVSGGAKNTFVFSQPEAAIQENKINKLLTEEAYLVQPFMPEIKTRGEWSLLFFNGRFSHAVRKVPQNGDFRVQHYFGGSIIPASPPPAVLDYALQLIKQFAPGCLYVRVDGLESASDFKLMELELIEPLLYLQADENLYANYYRALREMIW
jgi:glutathione synthase/RimK-type ligase-like ATP-grasp enzyme